MTTQNQQNSTGANVTVAISRTGDRSALPEVSRKDSELQHQHAKQHGGGDPPDGLDRLVQPEIARDLRILIRSSMNPDAAQSGG